MSLISHMIKKVEEKQADSPVIPLVGESAVVLDPVRYDYESEVECYQLVNSVWKKIPWNVASHIRVKDLIDGPYAFKMIKVGKYLCGNDAVDAKVESSEKGWIHQFVACWMAKYGLKYEPTIQMTFNQLLVTGWAKDIFGGEIIQSGGDDSCKTSQKPQQQMSIPTS